MATIDTTGNVWSATDSNTTKAQTNTAQAATNPWQLDESKQTVSGQVNNLLQKDNPIMQTARTQAMQQANDRGMINSTMAAQAGEQAAIQTALPIAQADAQVNATNAQFNADQASKTNMFNTSESNKLVQTGLDLDNRVNLANIEANYKNLMQANSSAFQTYQQTIKNISDIQQNKDMTADTKTAAITEQVTMLKNGFNLLGGINNLNLSGLLNF